MDNHHRKHSLGAFTGVYRRRRITWCILITFAVVFLFGAPWELPSYLKDIDYGLSRANIAKLVRTKSGESVDEIYGLLYLVTREDDRRLGEDVGVEQIDLGSYAGGDGSVNWEEEMKDLNERYPVVVFSKTYCPYSKKAKELIEKHELKLPPKVIEVDLRDDSDLIKIILYRLTGRDTFPNVLVKGKTIGGYDQLVKLDADHELARILTS